MPKGKVQLPDSEVLDLLSDTVTANGQYKLFRPWVEDKLKQIGPFPWNNKDTMQEKVNSLLRYHLTCLPYDTYHVRTYLEDSDPVDVWARGIRDYVVEHINF